VVQPKYLNLPPEVMRGFLTGRTIARARGRGKWLFLDLDPGGHLLVNLGMGGGACLHPLRRFGDLSPAEVEALWTSMRAVLRQGIEKGGSEKL